MSLYYAGGIGQVQKDFFDFLVGVVRVSGVKKPLYGVIYGEKAGRGGV